jgi:hypothetical protein
MTPTDVAAWVGAITGSLVLLWDVFKWVHSGARVRVSAAPNMRAYGSALALLGTKTCIAVEASNVGQAKTTITHVVGFHYTSPVHKFLQRKPLKSIIVPDPKLGAVPHALDVGERWLGMMEQNEEIEELSRNGALYVGVYHSSGKRPELQRVIIHAPRAS